MRQDSSHRHDTLGTRHGWFRATPGSDCGGAAPLLFKTSAAAVNASPVPARASTSPARRISLAIGTITPCLREGEAKAASDSEDADQQRQREGDCAED